MCRAAAPVGDEVLQIEDKFIFFLWVHGFVVVVVAVVFVVAVAVAVVVVVVFVFVVVFVVVVFVLVVDVVVGCPRTSNGPQVPCSAMFF